MNFDPSLHLTVFLCVLVAATAATIVLVHRQSVSLRIERLKAESLKADREIEHRIISGPPNVELASDHPAARIPPRAAPRMA